MYPIHVFVYISTQIHLPVGVAFEILIEQWWSDVKFEMLQVKYLSNTTLLQSTCTVYTIHKIQNELSDILIR